MATSASAPLQIATALYQLSNSAAGQRVNANHWKVEPNKNGMTGASYTLGAEKLTFVTAFQQKDIRCAFTNVVSFTSLINKQPVELLDVSPPINGKPSVEADGKLSVGDGIRIGKNSYEFVRLRNSQVFALISLDRQSGPHHMLFFIKNPDGSWAHPEADESKQRYTLGVETAGLFNQLERRYQATSAKAATEIQNYLNKPLVIGKSTK